MRRPIGTFLLQSLVLLASVNLLVSSAQASSIARPRQQRPSQFQSWIDAGSSHSSFDPSSPDNWLGGTGSWSNGADWSAGEPGGSSDVFISTGNDNVTLDVSANINSLTLGGSTGSSTLTSNGNTLTIAGALTINQSGTLTFDAAGITVSGNAMNAGAINLSQGSGLSAQNFSNSGSIMMNNSAGISAAGMLTNSGSIQSADMISGVSGGTVVNSGVISAYSVSSSGNFSNQTGGSVNAQNLNVGGNFTNEGAVLGIMRGSQMNIAGQLTNSGTFDTTYAAANIGSLNNLNGGGIFVGVLTVRGDASNSGGILVAFADLGGGQYFSIDGTLTNTQTGSIEIGGYTSGSANALVNQGTIDVIAAEGTGGRFGAGTVSNTGTIETEGNGNNGGNTLNFNTLNNRQGGVVILGGTSDVATIGSVTNAGSISVANGATLTVPPSSHATGNALSGFLNSGIVQIASGGTLSSLNKYTQTTGQTTIDGTLQGQSNFAGGAVYGNGGTIQGSVTSSAAFNLGDMPMTVGTMAIMGNYTQGANGSLYVDIASLTQYDQLSVSGRAVLNGLLSVDLLNGYIPQIGNLFDIVNFAGSSGTFSMVLGLPINNQEHFVLEYNSTDLTLDVVSGPDLQANTGHWSGSGDVYYEPYVSAASQAANQAYELGSAPQGSVPEPSSLVLLASGIAGIAALRRKNPSKPEFPF